MYPIVGRKDLKTYIAGRSAGVLEPHDLVVNYERSSAEDLPDEICAVLDGVISTWRALDLASITSDQARDAVEGELSASLHDGFRELPANVLTDRGFWRFCAGKLYDYVIWRHQTSKSEPALHPYFGVVAETLGFECVPHRMFNRALIAHAGGAVVGSDDPYALAKFGARDVWASHILRVRTSYAPAVARELLVDVRDGKLPTLTVRLLAKNLKRVRSNVLFEVLDEHQARVLMDRETERVRATHGETLDSVGDDS